MRFVTFVFFFTVIAYCAGPPPQSPAQSPPTCTLSIELIDAQSGEMLPGLVQIRRTDGSLIDLPGLINHGHDVEGKSALHDWWAIVNETAVEVPQEKISIRAITGLETEKAQRELDLKGKSTADVQVPLNRFYNARKNGRVAGNTHLHLQKMSKALADRYLSEMPLADGLDVVFLSYLERAVDDLEYTSNNYSRADLERLSNEHLKLGHGEEHRHNFGAYGEGYGHILLLDIARIIHPVSIGPGITKSGTDAPPLQEAIDKARREGGKVVWAHNRYGFEDIPNWLTGRVHANNIFDGGTRGSYKDSFYRYLNIGLRVPFSSGTDWFIYDFCRAYVLTDRAITPKEWLDALAAGRSYITNGPLLEFTVDGKQLGDVIELSGPAQIRVHGRAIGRIDFRRIEMVQNGKVVNSVASEPEGGHFAAKIDVELPVTEPCWLALRTPPPAVADDPELQTAVPENDLGAPLFGHTSPIYVRLAGRDVFDVAVAEHLLAEMTDDLEQIKEKAVFADEHQRHDVLHVYDDAIRELKKRIKAQQKASDAAAAE